MTEIPERCVNVRNAGSIVDRPLLNTEWMLPNSTIVFGLLSAQIASWCGTLA